VHVESGKPMVLCYDGSDDATNAIAVARRLFPGRRAIVVCAWEPFLPIYTGYPGWPVTGDEPMKDNAVRLAEEGCERAGAAGIEATPVVVEADDGVARAVLAVADEEDAAVIVMGTRGLTGLRSVVLGSVSHEVVQHARRPVAIVPSAALADARKSARRRRA
jgi:nucleotide-binding universal stress UspA family protein